jgi:hypothetical protein
VEQGEPVRGTGQRKEEGKMTRRTEPIGISVLACGGLILAALALPGMTPAQETGRCYKADVPAPMILPDGSEHGPGRLKLCLIGKGPVDGLHKTYVDGIPIGEFRSRRGTSEGRGEAVEAFFVFLRGVDGRLLLEGYAVASGEKLRTYHMGRVRGPTTTAWVSAPEPKGADKEQDRFIRIAVKPGMDRKSG